MEKNKNFIDMSLKEIYTDWNINIKYIIDDLTKLLYEYDKYSNNFNNIDEPSEWWSGIVMFFKEIYRILTVDNRGIHFGLLLILISIMLFIIQITS